MIRTLLFATTLLFVSFAESAAELTGSVNQDGFIVISGTGEALVGVDFASKGGYLIPVPPGDLTASAAPFQFLLANSATQVTFGNLASEVVVDGEIVLSVGYDMSGNDLIAEWGSRELDVPMAFPVVLPEPSAAALAVMATLSMLRTRRRRLV